MDKTVTITMRGREYPVRVTMGAMVMYRRETGEDPATLQDNQDLIRLLQWMYFCMKSACRADDVEFGFSFDEFCDQLTPEMVNDWHRRQAEMEQQQAKKK